jgi:hypothetical protein
MQPIHLPLVGWAQETTAMMIFMLAAAMTVAMLIATLLSLHQEATRVRFDHKRDRMTPFGPF